MLIFVTDGPEGDGEDHTVYASIGDTITLIAAINVDGNPFPFYGWGFGNIQVNLTGRYSSDSVGQLTIENVLADDFGPYVFGTHNGIGEDFTIDVTLTEAGELIRDIITIPTNIHKWWYVCK